MLERNTDEVQNFVLFGFKSRYLHCDYGVIGSTSNCEFESDDADYFSHLMRICRKWKHAFALEANKVRPCSSSTLDIRIFKKFR